MNIVIFDGYTINPGDLSWEALESLGSLSVYDATEPDRMFMRARGAEAILTSKCTITREFMEQCPDLKYIGSTATGYNNIDVAAAKELGIAVTYVPAYATEAVAQHTIALMLEFCNQVALHDASVKKGEWRESGYFCYWKKPLTLLAGKSLGIIGYGQIGRKVAAIAEAMGMTVNVYSRDPEAAVKSDFVSLHCPLTEENKEFVNSEFLVRMKPGAVLINTSRGGLIDERALAEALDAGFIRAAAVDVLSQEPPEEENPLLNHPNCIVTPHLAWTPKEMRGIICQALADNLHSYLTGGTLNRIDI